MLQGCFTGAHNTRFPVDDQRPAKQARKSGESAGFMGSASSNGNGLPSPPPPPPLGATRGSATVNSVKEAKDQISAELHRATSGKTPFEI